MYFVVIKSTLQRGERGFHVIALGLPVGQALLVLG
jgi:hypothetical protein